MSGVGEYFSSIFGKSPFKTVQEHMNLCVEAANGIVPLLEAANAGDMAEVERLQREISSTESQADELKSEIRSNLPRGFLLPVARADLLDLLTRQDKLANRAQDIAGLILGRRMAIPEQIQSSMVEYARISLGSCQLACTVVMELDELIESSFSGREAERVVKMIGEVERLEVDSDVAQVGLRKALFEIEKEIHAIDAMFLYQIIDLIGDLADIAERVGHRVQMMVAK